MSVIFTTCPVWTEGNATDALQGFFPTQRAAITNGVAVLDLIQKHTPEAERSLQQYIGRMVAFHGGAAPTGGNADLVVGTNVLLKVEIVPYKDVRPLATYWDAFVLGKIKGFDYTNRVIRIEARPEDWHKGDTM